MTIEFSTTDRRDGKALALFAACDLWQTGHTKDGRPFFAIPGSEPGLYHMTDQRDCSCPDRQRRGEVCKHMRAVRLWMAAFKTGAVAPKPRPTDPTPADDRIALTPAGAAYLCEKTAQPLADDGEAELAFAELGTRLRGDSAGQPLVRYEELFPDDDDDPIGAARRRADARRAVVTA